MLLSRFVNGKLSKVELQIGPPFHFPDALEVYSEGELNRPVSGDSPTADQKQFHIDKMTIHAA